MKHLKGFIRIKDVYGIEHLVRPNVINRLSQAANKVLPPSVMIWTGVQQAIEVHGLLEEVAEQLELHL